ncbi:HTH-type transcriptional regulator / antitoxin HigA [Tissierella praeacuta DSM 18095]|uniref:HTH-type transcriptional regulator / antitoxin HigA n=1 Tax=Tissierella praeacuta DSM 18095 TaxID=1123404 RepID=A0A1M4Z262_9FIRM|nr:HigA family addiction module antitoxin [Tissierella praeacuta]SHF12159.1 HTH-type transcriptional regulator / antitoxin HigA [Tissierella praeacuta DSM 18095]SUP00620.1 Plasmid maintenance system antidote protein [Tissierella praeacuta]
MIKEKIEYIASIAVPPGETLKEQIDSMGMTQVELAKRTGLTTKHINEIIKGKSPITQETSLKLEYVLGIPASFWNNLEANYQETKARIKAREEINNEMVIAREVPYPEIAKLGWIPSTRDIEEKVMNLRTFFGVASLNLLPETIKGAFAFRISEKYEASNYSLATWLRKGEIEAERIATETFNKSKLKKLIPKFRELTLEAPDVFYPKMVELCASCGIALVLVPHISKTYACGATNWVKSDRAIVQLSVRGARADIFWFTFFHEIAHIILHDRKEFHLQESKSGVCIEDEADNQAGNWLIPPEEYGKFVSTASYSHRENILLFAEQIDIHPCIVVGRLLHDKKIEYHQYNDLRPSFVIVSNKK